MTPFKNLGEYKFEDLLKLSFPAIEQLVATTSGPPSHENCRCLWLPNPVEVERTEINKLGCKAAASILLSDRITKRVVVPSADEWIGFNLLDLDEELPKYEINSV